MQTFSYLYAQNGPMPLKTECELSKLAQASWVSKTAHTRKKNND